MLRKVLKQKLEVALPRKRPDEERASFQMLIEVVDEDLNHPVRAFPKAQEARSQPRMLLFSTRNSLSEQQGWNDLWLWTGKGQVTSPMHLPRYQAIMQ